jgi:acetyltransferase-like isoleucine patch superfamily enzyme
MGNVKNISSSAIIYSSRIIMDHSVQVGEYSILGKKGIASKGKTIIEKGCIIGAHAIIYQGVILKKNIQVEDFCRIGEDTIIGKNCRIVYGAKIYGDVEIGGACVIGGFICEDVRIGKCCRIFGEIVHEHGPNKNFCDIKEWDVGGASAPVIGNNVFIGFGAIVAGKVKVGDGSYIFPGAIITKDVLPNSRVKGINGSPPK